MASKSPVIKAAYGSVGSVADPGFERERGGILLLPPSPFIFFCSSFSSSSLHPWKIFLGGRGGWGGVEGSNQSLCRGYNPTR